MVQEFDTLQLYRHVADMWWKRVQPHERPGTHPNESGTIKYPHFDYLRISLHQTVQEFDTLQLYGHVVDTCTAT